MRHKKERKKEKKKEKEKIFLVLKYTCSGHFLFTEMLSYNNITLYCVQLLMRVTSWVWLSAKLLPLPFLLFKKKRKKELREEKKEEKEKG